MPFTLRYNPELPYKRVLGIMYAHLQRLKILFPFMSFNSFAARQSLIVWHAATDSKTLRKGFAVQTSDVLFRI